MKLGGVILIILVGFAQAFSFQCPCKPPEPGEVTHLGGNEVIHIIEKTPYQQLKGVVQDATSEPFEGVLVEVFDKPEWILNGDTFPSPTQKRLNACKTDEFGRFCFANLPAGRYELRFSKDSGWNPSYMSVVLNPHHRKRNRKKMIIRLLPGS